jgi:hypothetical protein
MGLNARSLLVASVTFKAMACAPIHRSLFPIKAVRQLIQYPCTLGAQLGFYLERIRLFFAILTQD